MDSASPLAAGTTLGRYRIDALIGTGGMGAVYRAYDTVLKRPLAIKVLREGGDPTISCCVKRRAPPRSITPPSAPSTKSAASAAPPSSRWSTSTASRWRSKIAEGPLEIGEVLRIGHRRRRRTGARARARRDSSRFEGRQRDRLGERPAQGRGLRPGAPARPGDGGRADPGVDLGSGRHDRHAVRDGPGAGEGGDARSPDRCLGARRAALRNGVGPSAVRRRDDGRADGRDPARSAGAAAAESGSRADSRHHRDVPGQGSEPALSARRGREARAPGDGRWRGVANQVGRACWRRLPSSGRLSWSGRRAKAPLSAASASVAGSAEAWALAKAGRRQLCLVAGEPGIGKTRLSLEFARQCADENAIVLVGRCDEEALVPYQPFVEALGWYARTAPEQALRAAIPANGGGDLAAFAPEFLARLPNLPEPTPMNAAGQRYRLFESVSGLLSAMSAGGAGARASSTTSTGPTSRRCRCCATSFEDPSRPRCLLIGTYRESEVGGRSSARRAARGPAPRVGRDARRSSPVSKPGEVGTLIAALSAANVPAEPGASGRREHRRQPVLRERDGAPSQRNGSGGRAARRRPRSHSQARVAIERAVRPRPHAWPPSSAASSTSTCSKRSPTLPENDLLDAIDEARQAQLVDEAAGKPGRYSLPSRAHPQRAVRRHGGDAARAHASARRPRRSRRLSADSAEPPLADLAYHFTQAASVGVADGRPTTPTRAARSHGRCARSGRSVALLRLCAAGARRACRPGLTSSVSAWRIHRRRGRAFSNLGAMGPISARHSTKRSSICSRIRRRSAARSSPTSARPTSGCSTSRRWSGSRPKR